MTHPLHQLGSTDDIWEVTLQVASPEGTNPTDLDLDLLATYPHRYNGSRMVYSPNAAKNVAVDVLDQLSGEVDRVVENYSLNRAGEVQRRQAAHHMVAVHVKLIKWRDENWDEPFWNDLAPGYVTVIKKLYRDGFQIENICDDEFLLRP